MKYVKSKVVMLPTEKASQIAFLTKKGEEVFKDLRFFEKPVKCFRDVDLTRPQHLYFLSDEEIKEGDWYLNSINQYTIHQATTDIKERGSKKIIATTDETLKFGEDIPGYIKYKSLPRPSNEFLKKYCELGGTDEVMVEYIRNSKGDIADGGKETFLKVAPDNTITVKPIKDSWSKEEIIELCWKSWRNGIDRGKFKLDLKSPFEYQFFENWIKENL